MHRTSDQRAGKTAAVLRCALTFHRKYGKLWTFYSCYISKKPILHLELQSCYKMKNKRTEGHAY